MAFLLQMRIAISYPLFSSNLRWDSFRILSVFESICTACDADIKSYGSINIPLKIHIKLNKRISIDVEI